MGLFLKYFKNLALIMLIGKSLANVTISVGDVSVSGYTEDIVVPVTLSNPENIVENLEQLILNRKLRELLGTLGIQYVKKYHSIESGKYFFKKIYNQLLNGVDEDLINMYHPLKSNYAKQNYIKTPLKDNNIIT